MSESELLLDLAGDLTHASIVRVNRLAVYCVNRFALRKPFFEGSQIGGQRTKRTLFLTACPQNVDRRIKVKYPDSGSTEDLLILGISEGATPECEHELLVGGRFGDALPQNLTFELAEVVLAVKFEDVGYLQPGARDDAGVEVNEVAIERAGELLADGSFTGTHESDEDDQAWRRRLVGAYGVTAES